MEKQDRHIEVLARFMQGATTGEEEQALLVWLREPASKEALAAYYQQKWEASRHEALEAEIQCRMFMRLKAQIGESQPVGSKPMRATLRPFARWMRYAVAVCVGLIAGWSVYFAFEAWPEEEQLFVVSADRGQRANITLPDGTLVWLNSHTQLRYGTRYGEQDRVVELDGEAYFKAYSEDKDLVATLLEGKVRTSIDGQSAILCPDQQAAYDKAKGKLQVSYTEDAAYACMWREDELAFSGETLEEIASLFKRMYNVEVEFETENIKSCRFSGVIKNNSLENVIELISLTAPIAYRAKGDTIILSARK